MPTKEYYQKNKETYLKRSSDFYEKNKEVIKEEARIKYHNLSPEEKKNEMNMLKIVIITYLKIKRK